MPTLKVTGQEELYFHVATKETIGTLGGPMTSLDAVGHSSLRVGWEPPGRVLAMQKETGTTWVTGHLGPVCTTGQRSRRADGGFHEVVAVREISFKDVDKEDVAATEDQMSHLFNLRNDNGTDLSFGVELTGFAALASKTGQVPQGQKVRFSLGLVPKVA